MFQQKRSGASHPHLGHDHVLTFLDVLALGLDDGVEEVEVLDMAAVRCQAVDEVMQHALRDLAAQLVVITEDVLHCLRLQELDMNKEKFGNQKGFTSGQSHQH